MNYDTLISFLPRMLLEHLSLQIIQHPELSLGRKCNTVAYFLVHTYFINIVFLLYKSFLHPIIIVN